MAFTNNPWNEAGYDVFVVAGQSNCLTGQGADFANLDAGNSRTYCLGRAMPERKTTKSNNENGEFVEMAFWNTDYRVTSILNQPTMHNWASIEHNGFDRHFAQHYIDNGHLTGTRDIMLVTSAWPGTGFGTGSAVTADGQNAYWGVGEYLYEDMLVRTNFVMRQNPLNTLKGVLWMQGEEDWFAKNETQYSAALDAQIADFRSRVQVSNRSTIPWIVGGQIPFWVDNNGGTSQGVYQSLINIASRVSNTGFADPRTPTTIQNTLRPETEDPLHYDAAAQRELGLRFYTAWASL